jgi:hypothetical protein
MLANRQQLGCLIVCLGREWVDWWGTKSCGAMRAVVCQAVAAAAASAAAAALDSAVVTGGVLLPQPSSQHCQAARRLC